MISDGQPDYRFILIDAQTSQTLVVTAWRGLSDFWRIQVTHAETPVAETIVRLRDNPALAWIVNCLTFRSAP